MIIVIQISVYNIRSKGTIPLASCELKKGTFIVQSC